jgi:hypothetical protein
MADKQKPPFELTTTAPDDTQTIAPFGDEAAGRDAWLAAIAGGAFRYASLVRTSGPHRTRYRCEWSRLGTFRDVTAMHGGAIVDLCRELTVPAPSGYSASVVDDGRIVFDGPTGRHNLGDVACNTGERVRVHWSGYLPAKPNPCADCDGCPLCMDDDDGFDGTEEEIEEALKDRHDPRRW